LAHSRKLRAILDAADRRIDKGAGIGHDEFWQQVAAATRSRVKNGNVGNAEPNAAPDRGGIKASRASRSPRHRGR
jgi:hypothetical protein